MTGAENKEVPSHPVFICIAKASTELCDCHRMQGLPQIFQEIGATHCKGITTIRIEL